MKRMNRIIALMLSVVLLIGCLSAVTVSAATDAVVSITTNKSTVKRGETVQVTVAMSNNTTPFFGAQVAVQYDATVFDAADGTINQSAENFFGYSDLNIIGNVVQLVGARSKDNGSYNGTLFTFNLTAKADAALGSYPLTYVASDTMFGQADENGDSTDLNVEYKTASVAVSVPLEGISLNKTSLTLNKGQEETLVATLKPADAVSDITWTSSKTSVATVDNGKIVAVAPGSATITAKAGSYTAKCTVTVKSPLESISLNKSELTLAKGKYETLTVTYNPTDTTDSKTVSWSSDNTAVATVSSGRVTAKAPGTATITAKVGDKTATCQVTVTVALTGISLNKTTATMGKNDTMQLEVTYKPADTTDDKTVTWTSDNEAVAKVDANGKVTTGTTGKAVITAKVGSYTAKCTITVEAIITDFTLSHSAHTMDKGDTVQLSVSDIIPDDTHQSKTVTWTSSNSSVAKVDSTGKVTAVSGGKTTITAKVGNVKKTCEITVNLPLTKIELNAGILEMTKGETYQLKVSYTPSNTTDDKTVTWSVYNKDIASVDANGKLTALKEGNTVVFAYVGELTAICEVHVTEIHLESVELSQSKLDLKVSKTADLSYTLTPNKDTITDEIGAAVWSSDNTSVATVENGKVTGIAPGSAVITVKVNDKSAQCVVNVTDIEIEDLEVSVEKSETCSLGKLGLQIKPETSTQLLVKFLPADFTVEPGEVTFASSDETVFTVDAEGKVNAIVLGEAELIVTHGSVVKKIPVIVTQSITPETGDMNMTGAFVLLAVLSLMGMAATCLYIFRRRNAQ